jgi:signal transduction histidine kinase
LLFGLVLIFFILNAALSSWSLQTLIGNYERVSRSHDVLDEISLTLSALKDSETGQRGFIITGDETFLQPYNDSLQEVGSHIQRLKESTADDPVQNERVLRLQQATNVRITTLNDNLRTVREKGHDMLIRSGGLYLGKEQMDHVRQVVAEIRSEELEKLRLRQAESQTSGRSSLITLLLSNLAGLTLLGAAYFFVMRFISERQMSIAKLQAAHDELEQRVVERTAKLNEANTELERSNRELQDFAFVASHDLQEPLRKIQAFGDRLLTLQAAKFDEQGRDYLDRMHSAAGRMHTLINDLLTFSRVTTKAQPFRPTDLNKVAHEVVGDLETRIEDSDGTVEIGHLPVIDADSMQMRQLFQNLIANALKFRKPDIKPLVKVESELLETDDNGRVMVRLTVADNGIGFDEKYVDRIFTPFQRLHGRNQYEGTGIGLAVCRKIVERHGGTLTAKSEEGSGSVFVVTLPLKHSKEK